MSKVRVHELAKQLGMESKEVLAKLQEMGEFVRSASSTVEAPVVRKLIALYPDAKPVEEKKPVKKDPAMIAAWIFALLLMARPGFFEMVTYWFWVKFVCVILMTGFHGFLAATRRKMAEGLMQRSSTFYRKINEIPPILTVIIVIMVIVKPF